MNLKKKKNELKKKICKIINENHVGTQCSPNTLVLSTAQVTVLAELSNTSKGTVTMTTRDHSRHEWMEEGNEVNLQMDQLCTFF